MVQSTSIFSQSFMIGGIVVDSDIKSDEFVNTFRYISDTCVWACSPKYRITTKEKIFVSCLNSNSECINIATFPLISKDLLSINPANLQANKISCYPICRFNYNIYSLQEVQFPANIKGEIQHYCLSSSKNFYPLGFPYSYYLLNLTLKKTLISNKLNMKLEVNYIIKK